MLKRTFEGWTDQNHAIAVRMWSENMSAADIATYIGATRNAVLGYMNRQRRDFPKKTEPASARAEGKGDTLKWFRWTRDNIALAAKMYADGASKQMIADAIGCSFHTAEKYFKDNRDIFPLRKQVSVVRVSPPQKEKAGAASSAAFIGDPEKWKSLPDLGPRDCRWIMGGAGASSLFCCEETAIGYSWCGHHRDRVYQSRAAA